MSTLISVLTCALLAMTIAPDHVVAPPRSSWLRIPQSSQAFEVASVKPKGPFRGPAEIGVTFLPGGRVVAVNAPIFLLLKVAFGSSERQLDEKGVPADLLNEVFDIEAKAGVNALADSASQEARDARLRVMLQTLLVDRFKLKFHRETREVPVYALDIAPGGPKLKSSPAGRACPEGSRCGQLSGGPSSGVKGLDVEISELVDTLISFGDRHVVDHTKISGKFDIELPPWSRAFVDRIDNPAEPSGDPNDPSIFAVLRRTLGLQLVATKGPLEILVVDHIERPTPNAPLAVFGGGSR